MRKVLALIVSLVTMAVALIGFTGAVITVDTLTATAASAAEPDRLNAGQSLGANQRLVSPNGQYVLIMQSDGNLVLYRSGGVAVWNTQTQGNNFAVMQSDGNFVLYRSGGGALWNTVTAGFGSNTYLAVQDDGNLVVYTNQMATWSRYTGYVGGRVNPGQAMGPGQVRRSPNGQYSLVMQGDGNLVLYRSGGVAVWNTRTQGNNFAVVQGDGNFVVYRSGGGALWNSQTAGRSGARLEVQDDGNVVLYQGSTAVWSWRSGVLGGGGGGSGASGSGSYANSRIADEAMRYNGQWGGQCRAFVGKVVSAVSGGSQNIATGRFGGNYFSSLAAYGPQITSVDALTKGDIVQIGETEAASNLHTFIIVGRKSGSTFTVVDSNHNYDERVHVYDRVVSLSSTQRAYRLGRP